jgi:SAM-dependent methyltransferase
MLICLEMSGKTSWNPECYAKNARFVSDLGEPLLRLLDPRPGEFILDLGCGDGALTEKIADCGAAVIGVDSSLSQLKASKKRGLEVVAMDGHDLAFKQRFDAVFTNAALHWMKQPNRVAAEIAKSLRPGGRFVGEFGGKGNVERIRSALYAALQSRNIDPAPVDPWYYPSAEEYSELLAKAGFTIDSIELIDRPTKLPGDIRSWLEIFAQSFTASVAEPERTSFLEEVGRKLANHLRDGAGNWFADYIRLRFKARIYDGIELKR